MFYRLIVLNNIADVNLLKVVDLEAITELVYLSTSDSFSFFYLDDKNYTSTFVVEINQILSTLYLDTQIVVNAFISRSYSTSQLPDEQLVIFMNEELEEAKFFLEKKHLNKTLFSYAQYLLATRSIEEVHTYFDRYDIESYIKLLEHYFYLDGNIVETANFLGVHRNTISNQIQKLIEITGLDPRRIDERMLYQIYINYQNKKII